MTAIVTGQLNELAEPLCTVEHMAVVLPSIDYLVREGCQVPNSFIGSEGNDKD